jgi:hypothetical protein
MPNLNKTLLAASNDDNCLPGLTIDLAAERSRPAIEQRISNEVHAPDLIHGRHQMLGLPQPC